MSSCDDLRALRRQLGYRFEAVVHLTAIGGDRLSAIEAGEAPTVFETEELARLYGISADDLGDVPIRLPSSVDALASLDEFRDVGDIARSRIIAATGAVRDLRWLQDHLGRPNAVERFREERPALAPKRDQHLPAEQGGALAGAVRRAWQLKSGPIHSMRDLVATRLPALEILHADLTHDGPAGISFVGQELGPAIVLNSVGKNRNPLVRRFSLAHELCHVLVDWGKKAPLTQISGYLTESGLEREQRANGFAVRLLCPETVLDRMRRRKAQDPTALARELGKYGLHYAAVRLYLHNVASADLPTTPPAEAIMDPDRWVAAEAPTSIESFPLSQVPLERRSAVARLSAEAFARGLISKARFAELLGTTRSHPVETVLDFYGLDPPADHAA